MMKMAKKGLRQGPSGCLGCQTQLAPYEEEMSQDTQGHVMMPAGPAADLIITQADQLYAFSEAKFGGPAHPTEPDKGSQAGISRRLAEITI